MELVQHNRSLRQRKSKKVRSTTLQALNEQALHHTFELTDVDWNCPIEKNTPWLPESFINLRHLPSYSLLSPAQKLRLNHLKALAVCEQFIWFEQDVISPVLQRIIASQSLDRDLYICLHNFINEENRHSRMFRALLVKAAPEIYENQKYWLVNFGWLGQKFFQQILSNPQRYLVWIWLAIYFEERTMHISRDYKFAKHPVDPTFRKVHQLHMIDEARHLQIDQYLLGAFYNNQPVWKKKLAALMLERVIASYTRPKRIALKMLDIVQKENLGDSRPLKNLALELKGLRDTPTFIKEMFSDQVIGRTRELLSLYPEMSNALRLMQP